MKELYSIKSHVFWIKTKEGKELILKKHKQADHVKQQWDFFNQMKQSSVIIPFIQFPNGHLFIMDRNASWTISPYIEGRKLHFDNETDRKSAIQTLKQFHHEAHGVFPAYPTIKKELFLVRWQQRLSTFRETEYLFKRFGYQTLYKDIVKTMIRHLELALQYPWESLDEEAKQKGQWIHGDVASHNFICSTDMNAACLIDFDLLSMGSALHDYIQIGQRFLPHIQWDLQTLLEYEMVQDTDIKYWLSGILIPSDVLREWIYFISRKSMTAAPSYLSKMESTWIKRGHFLKKAKSMIKSM